MDSSLAYDVRNQRFMSVISENFKAYFTYGGQVFGRWPLFVKYWLNPGIILTHLAIYYEICGLFFGEYLFNIDWWHKNRYISSNIRKYRAFQKNVYKISINITIWIIFIESLD